VDTKAIIDKTGYRRDYISRCGFSVSEDWEYINSTAFFEITNNESKTKHKINWSLIAIGELPNTPKRRIRNAISVFYTRRQKYKGKTPVGMFDDAYWNSLNDKLGEEINTLTIDHIIPMTWWDNTWEQMRLANDPRNLRLLGSKDNISRGNKLKASELDEYDLWDLYYQAENPSDLNLIEARFDIAS
jgi:hypothetical protein